MLIYLVDIESYFCGLFQSSKSERSAPRTPLHAVSPAQSTRVPQAPATTPATHGQMSPMKLYRDQSGLSTGSHKKATTPSRQNPSRENTRSPNAEIRAPTNSPRALTPEQTGNTTHFLPSELLHLTVYHFLLCIIIK